MSYAPANPPAIAPFSVQPLMAGAAQAAANEIYAGCSNGELLRFALQPDHSHTLVSRQTVTAGKSIDDIVIIPCQHRALIQSDGQLHFYTIPSLDPIPQNVIRPIRHVVTFAVDHFHLQRPPPPLSSSSQTLDLVDFCVVKKRAIAQYTLRDRLYYHKEIPLPQGGTLAKRIGPSLCIADNVHYNIINLDEASLFPILPLSQAIDPTPFPIKPSITVIGDSEFLILSWTGASTIGVFITGGTLEWPSYPESVCLDYPYIHNIETQSIVQVISAPATNDGHGPSERTALVASLEGYLVPSAQRSEKMQLTRVPLLHFLAVSFCSRFRRKEFRGDVGHDTTLRDDDVFHKLA
ncbi:hypothetical protein F5887DRAFT_1063626 [Amanita rubescens]|nr:hypothetical protein F5887DRAFT_1063626 [Amanita rubescens]